MSFDYDDGELKEIIDDEGIGYAVLSGVDAHDISSPETKRLWDAAWEALTNLQKHLDGQTSN